MSYEEEKTLINVRSAGQTMSALLFFDARMMLLLYTFLKRMHQEGILKGGEVEKFEKFMKATEGKFDLMNVPAELQADMKKELDELKIRYHILPQVNEKNEMCQIAVFTEDKQKFAAWYTNRIEEQLQKGGEKTTEELNRLTDRNTSIVSIPCKDTEPEAIEKLKADFNSLEINYAKLPDLNVGDGTTQFLVADADLKKVEHWFTLYKDDLLAKGEEVGEMTTITSEQYVNTGELTAKEYIAGADEKLQALNEKYEGKEKGQLEQFLNNGRAEIRGMDNEVYNKLHNDPTYREITINKETLVDNCSYEAAPGSSSAEFFFASRVPGTYGETEKTLILPKEQVFRTDNGKSYVAFLKKNEKPLTIEKNGRPTRSEMRLTGEELGKSYDKVERKIAKAENLSKEAPIQQAAKLAEKIPTNPVKVR